MHLDTLKKLTHSTTFVTSYIPVEILTVYATHFYITIISYFYFLFCHFIEAYNSELYSSPYYDISFIFMLIYIFAEFKFSLLTDHPHSHRIVREYWIRQSY